MKIVVERAQLSDIGFIYKVNQQNVPMVGDVAKEWFNKYFDVLVFGLAKVDGHPAGYIIGMTPETDYQSENFLWFKKRYKNFLYVDRLAVANEFQGQGVGKALYEHAAKIGAADFHSITCEVNIRPANQRSYDFHKKLGFVEVGQQETKGGQIRVAMLAKELRQH